MGTPQNMKPSSFKTVQRNFYQSILKWYGSDSVNEEEMPPNPPDVGDLVNILRCIGFKLRYFDKSGGGTSASLSSLNSVADGLKTSECRVVITCGQSGLRAVLESVVGECQCPPMESAMQAEYWQVSGSAPVPKGSQESLNSKVQEAGSSLIPPLAPPVATVVKAVMRRLLKISCNTQVGELNTSTNSVGGVNGNTRMSTGTNHSLHRSLDTLSLPQSKCYGSADEILESDDRANKTLFTRAISNVELSTCSVSPVANTGSPVESMKPFGTWTKQSSSPTSLLSASLERITLSDRNGIFCRLEVAKRSINEAMSMLNVKPLTVDTTKKMRIENTSTPCRVKKSVTVKKTPVTPGFIKKTNGSPSYIKKTSETAVSMKKTPTRVPAFKITSGTSGYTTKSLDFSGRSTPLIRSKSSVSVTSMKSEYVGTPHPRIGQTSTATTKTRKAIPKPVSQFVSPKYISFSKKSEDTPNKKNSQTPINANNVSSGSSSSASSSTSAKTRKLINVVRRVSRISSSGGTSNSKPDKK